jgi:hypothetical protein
LLLKEEENEGEAHQKLEEECEEGGKGIAEKQTPNEAQLRSRFPPAADALNPTGIAKVKILCRRMKSRVFHLFESDHDNSQNRITTEDVGPFPAVFAAAVYIDSAMDGLLVGISLLSGARSFPFTRALLATTSVFHVQSFKPQ